MLNEPIVGYATWEKVRYKWRRRRTIVRFVVVAFARWRKKQETSAIHTNSHHQAQKEPRSSKVQQNVAA